MRITLIKGIGGATERELNRIGLHSLEDINAFDKVELVKQTNISTKKLMIIMKFYKVDGMTPERIEQIRDKK